MYDEGGIRPSCARFLCSSRVGTTTYLSSSSYVIQASDQAQKSKRRKFLLSEAGWNEKREKCNPLSCAINQHTNYLSDFCSRFLQLFNSKTEHQMNCMTLNHSPFCSFVTELTMIFLVGKISHLSKLKIQMINDRKNVRAERIIRFIKFIFPKITRHQPKSIFHFVNWSV